MSKIRHPDVIVARERAHAVFDLLWSCRVMSKTEAYAWLRKEFGRPKVEAHIGRMSIEQCRRIEEKVPQLLLGKKELLRSCAEMATERAKHQSRADLAENKVKELAARVAELEIKLSEGEQRKAG